MSNFNYINDFFKTLNLDIHFSHYFLPIPYDDIDSFDCLIRFVRLRAIR